MTEEAAFKPGLVEGFFGMPWSWHVRENYAGFLAESGFGSYLYAPKNDAYFRKQWFRPCPRHHLENLQKLRRHFQSADLDFGIGLSPFELYRDFTADNQQLLKNKLDEINALAPDTLCILFDDMQGNVPDLARCQADIMDFVSEHSNAAHFSLCPTYYSSDPVLTTHFGAMPEHYLRDLGRLLDPGIGIFWTGPRVFSSEYPTGHLQEIGSLLQRKPLIWDNYPVNDAQRLTSFLHLRPFERDTGTLLAYCNGHLVNPMNQAWLSRIPLYTLAALYEGRDTGSEDIFEQACLALCGTKLGAEIVADCALFQDTGLDNMSADTRKALSLKYSHFIDSPYAREIEDWLAGDYDFDPACLT